ncbi:carboxymuconolactone decarboxylase family protein [Actinacidiphila paucisporea]|uniref:4-carboxymuconolactone decarboxylase n=1 Tax=Actinacidiphila paucisporea TaxID=310782 RepID=A0A1M6U799_9ACTN|nr:carboxymuconolactone decarboxylase family protein [Actinacidiphila paucisporea]SHK64958.1 4-carboxymuconolactone decarboxylase [Actinacidiphila paucisporea]
MTPPTAPASTSATAPEDRYARGLAALSLVTGTEHPAVLDPIAEIAPDLARFTVEFGYGDIWSQPGLTPRQRQIGTIAALAALGNAAPQLRFHIAGALNVGCTRREITETFIHATVYAGYPAALNALAAAREVFAAHPDPDAAAPATEKTPEADRYARGIALLQEVDGPAGPHVVDSLADLAPDLGRFLVEHVFGEVYARTGLDLPTRELASVAMCTALGTAGPQLRVHLRAFLNVGGTREEIIALLTQLAGYAGFPAALNGVAAAREIFAEQDAKG